MSEEGAALSITEANTAARAQLVNRLQRLWQSDPASYWKEFKASGLEARDVWADAFVYVESDKLKSVPAKQPGKSAR
jgi:hypothetical protein